MTFSNLPIATPGYVGRPLLEKEVLEALTNDRHPIVTLVGRGGIGKPSVALSMLREIAHTNRYDVIVWFSARDNARTMSGARLVQAHMLTNKDTAKESQSIVEIVRAT